jgi:hypothetical protein
MVENPLNGETGVLEQWSDGVMDLSESHQIQYGSYPVLQYSTTPLLQIKFHHGINI